MPISWSLDDFPHFEFPEAQTGLQAASGVLENWTGDFDYLQDQYDWGVITYTFHPFVSGRGHRMMMMARLIEHLKRRGAIFMTMEQAAEEARTRLEGAVELSS